MSHSSNPIVKRMAGPGRVARERPVGGPFEIRREAREQARESRSDTTRLREDWFERTYQRVRGFLDEMFP